MATDCLEYGPGIVFKGGAQQVMSPNVTMAHAAPARYWVMRSTSQSRQPLFATVPVPYIKTASWASVTRAQRALATLQVQGVKGVPVTHGTATRNNSADL